jgi:hypothetical protein
MLKQDFASRISISQLCTNQDIENDGRTRIYEPEAHEGN